MAMRHIPTMTPEEIMGANKALEKKLYARMAAYAKLQGEHEKNLISVMFWALIAAIALMLSIFLFSPWDSDSKALLCGVVLAGDLLIAERLLTKMKDVAMKSFSKMERDFDGDYEKLCAREAALVSSKANEPSNSNSNNP